MVAEIPHRDVALPAPQGQPTIRVTEDGLNVDELAFQCADRAAPPIGCPREGGGRLTARRHSASVRGNRHAPRLVLMAAKSNSGCQVRQVPQDHLMTVAAGSDETAGLADGQLIDSEIARRRGTPTPTGHLGRRAGRVHVPCSTARVHGDREGT